MLNRWERYDSIVKRMNKYMMEAYKEAEKARDKGEIPIGAVVVKDQEIIGRGHNLVEGNQDPTAHAEMVAIKAASTHLGSRRLIGCQLYVTMEPCSMCAGAITLARIETLYIGTMDEKAGACGSIFNVVQEESLNHRVEIQQGMMQEECSTIVKEFFKQLRKRGKNT